MSVECPFCKSVIHPGNDSSHASLLCEVCGNTVELVGPTVVVPGDSDPSDSLGLDVSEQVPASPQVGKFRLIERVGSGGFGTVWKARDTELDRIVALKFPRNIQIEPGRIDQFLREAKAAAQLRHPNIVTVYEVSRHDETICVVSEFVEGKTLDEQMRERPFTHRDAVRLCAQLCDALAHAHARGVIHRDLKPGNVMLDDDGQPHVMDFGLAKRLATDVNTTLEGQILGTPAYMSPEQAKGEGYIADARTDLYSVGVILFELLTGERPFRGELRMLLHQVVHDDPPSPRRLNHTVSRDLETICLKCLEKDSDRRYRSARELREELERVLRGEPILARPITRSVRAWRWCRRKPLVASLSAAIVLLLVGVSIAAPLVAWNEKQLRGAADLARDEARRAADTTQAINDYILKDMLGAADPYRGKGHDITVLEVVNQSIEGIAKRFHDQPELEADVRAMISQTYLGLGQHEKALEQISLASQIHGQVLGPNHAKTLADQVSLGTMQHMCAQFDKAEDTLRSVLERSERHLGPHDFTTLHAQAALGETLQVRRKHDEADRQLANAIGDLREHHPQEQQVIAIAISSLAASYYARNKLEEAERWSREQLDLCRQMADQEGLLSALNMLANITLAKRRFQESLEIRTELLANAKKILPPEHWHLASIHLGTAAALTGLERHEDARDHWLIAYDSMRQALGPDHTLAIRALAGLMKCLQSLDRQTEIAEYCETFLFARFRTCHHDDRKLIEEAIALYLEQRRRRGPFDESMFSQQLMDATDQQVPRGHTHRNIYLANVGWWLLQQSDYARAEPFLLESYNSLVAGGGEDPDIPWLRRMLNSLYLARGNAAEAAKYVDGPTSGVEENSQ